MARHGYVKPLAGQGYASVCNRGFDYRSLNVTFVTPEGKEINVQGKEGDNLLDIAHGYSIDLEGVAV